MYLEKHFKQFNIHYFFHDGKQHGLTDKLTKEILDKDLDLLFIPDAGTSDVKNHKVLYDNNITVLIADHHQALEESPYAVTVNNQLSPEYENKQISGAGITYKILQKMDDFYGFETSKKMRDLVAVSQVSDSMSMIEPETRFLTYDGISNLHNPLLKEMIFKHIGKWEKVNVQSLAYMLIPKVNATIRTGSMEDKKEVFYAMIGRDVVKVNPRTKKEENSVVRANRLATNAHAKQNRSKKKWLGIIKEKIEAENLNSRPILVITFEKEDKFENALGGVIASGLTNVYRKPVIILTDKESNGIYSGSLRGYDDFSDDLKSFLEELNVFDWIQGHGNAAGCQITSENLKVFEQLQDKMKEQFALDGNSGENEIKVDFIISAKNMRGQIVDEVSKYEKYWGKGIEAPVFAIEGLEIDMNDVKVSSGGMIKLSIAGTDYTMFSASEDWIELAETNQIVTFDAIGTMGINEFLGKSTRQFIMDNYVIKSVEESKKKKVLFEF